MLWHRSLYSKRSLPEIDTRPPISINELTAAESDQNWWSERGFIVIQEHSLRAHVHVRGLRQPVDVYVIYSFLCTDTPRSTLTRDTESFLFTARWQLIQPYISCTLASPPSCCGPFMSHDCGNFYLMGVSLPLFAPPLLGGQVSTMSKIEGLGKLILKNFSR